MLLDYVFGDTFHTEDLDLETLPVGQGILYERQGLFVDLVHVDGKTSCCVQPPATTVALEMLGLLMGDQELEIFEISFAVVAPWPRQELFDIGLLSLLLAHLRASKETMALAALYIEAFCVETATTIGWFWLARSQLLRRVQLLMRCCRLAGLD